MLFYILWSTALCTIHYKERCYLLPVGGHEVRPLSRTALKRTMFVLAVW